MKTRYVFHFIFACLCTLLFGTIANAQTVLVNGGSTSCTSLTIVTTANGVNLQTVPANCLGAVSTNPTVSSVSPACINAGGTAITINGANLSGATSVVVGGQTVAAASFTSNTGSAITLTVPAAATTGAGTLTVNTPTANPTASFQIGSCSTLPNVTLVALSTNPNVAATSADPGAKLIIKGSAFTGAVVRMNGAVATITPGGGTDTQLEVTVPNAPGSGGIIITTGNGSFTAPFTVNGVVVTDPNNVSVTGKTLGNPSKNPQAIPSSGDNGAGINAFDMTPTRCKGSPAPTKSWQHNIDLADYRANAALEFISMGSGQTLSYKFTVPSTASGYGSFSTEENTSVITPGTMIGISSQPCDFDTAKLKSGTLDFCYSNITAVANTMLYEVSNGAGGLGGCTLKPGQTYYLNLRFLKPSGGSYVDACPANATCGFTLGFR
jgi:hypothetical protein